MSLSPQARRLLCLIAGLSTADGVTPDAQTLGARASIPQPDVHAAVATLVADGLVADPGSTREQYRLTMAGWDVVDDLAAVHPRADLDEKQREYSRAAAAVRQFTEFGSPAGSATTEFDIAAALAAEELAKHRYDRALARYLDQQQRQPAAAR